MAKIKCESCGSTRWQNSQLDNILECQYCGAMQPQVHNRKQQQPNQQQSWGKIAVLLPLIVVFMLVTWWFVFVQYRKHSQYQEETTVKPTVVNTQTTGQPQEQSTAEQGVTKAQIPTIATTANNTVQQPVNADLQIVHQVAGETSLGGQFWIFELSNQGEHAIAKPGVVVSGFDADGQRLVEQSGWSQQEVLAPNETTALMVFLSEPPEGMVKTAINTLGKVPQKYDLKQVSYKVESFVVKEVRNRYEIVGDVLNDTEDTLSYSKIVVFAKNKAGQVVGVANGFATVKNIKPRETSGFKITMGTFLTEKPDSWSLMAFARPAS